MRTYVWSLTVVLFLIFAGSPVRAAAQQAHPAPAHGAAHPKEAAKPADHHDHGDDDDDPPFPVEGGGKIAAGWTAKIDPKDSITKVKFEAAGEGWHSRTGTPVVLFRPGDVANGNYRLTVTFAQTEGSPGHAEPYGLLIGASGLAGSAAKQSYTSFSIRGDGKYQIRRRARGKGTDVTNGTVASTALHKMDDKGRCSNELTVVAGAADVRFLLNGTEVHRAKRADVDADGAVALRLSHNLDLNISAITITKS
jgi:hypothetical protein